MGLQFNFQYPETSGSELDLMRAGPIDEVAALAERWGFSGISLTDHPVPGKRWLEAGGHQTLEPFVGLAFAAAATERLRLLTNLAVGTYRQPFLLAKAAATLDKLSGGRLILGLGVGYLKGEYHALGVDYEQRNVLFDELLDVLPLHWSGEPFSYEGAAFSARDVIALPAPVQKPIPIWIGGNSPLSRRRAATRAQGWMPMIGGAELAATSRTTMVETLDDAAEKIAGVKAAAEAAGRHEALDFMAPYMEADLFDDPDRHRAEFARLEAAGLTWLTVSTAGEDLAATAAFLERFGTLYLHPKEG